MGDCTINAIGVNVRGNSILDITLSPRIVPEADQETRALPFDRVFDGEALTSHFGLFRLPVELYSKVLCELSSRDLAALALADRGCHQLARPGLFSRISLDYSPASQELLSHLASETAERSKRVANGQVPSTSTIGACVRSLAVATDKEWVLKVHRIDEDSLQNCDSAEDAEHWVVEATRHYYGHFLRLIGQVIKTGLPNLERLDWYDTALPPYVMSCVAHAPIKHLTLSHARIQEGFKVEDPAPGTRRWALRTLHLAVNLGFSKNEENDRDLGKFCMSIIRQAAPTLEVLKWAAFPELELGVLNADEADSLDFPRLHTLMLLEGINVAGSSFLDAVVRSRGNLRTLTELNGAQPLFSALAAEGEVQQLTALHLHGYAHVAGGLGVIAFISRNPQLQAFSVTAPIVSNFLTSQMPAVGTSLTALTSLHLVWADFTLEPRALEVVGSMTTLTALWLSADRAPAPHPPLWVVDHASLRSGPLARLTALQKLAFSRDVPQWVFDPSVGDDQQPPTTDYYTHQRLPVGLGAEDVLLRDGGEDEPCVELPPVPVAYYHRQLALSKRRWRAWEIWHRRTMVREAEAWAKVLPALEWACFGQIPVILTTKDIAGGGVAEKAGRAALIKRDEHHSHLKRVWGLGFR